MTQTPLPGSRWFRWVHNFTLRVGVMTGVFLTAVMIGAVLVANRVPIPDQFTELRNWLARGAFLFFALIPVACFLRAPVKMIAASMCGWAMLSVNYALMGFFFTNLHARLGKSPFQVLILGTIVYGVAACAAWVAGMVLSVRQQPIATSRRRL